MHRSVVLVVAILGLTATPVFSATWLVDADGTGDFPTIEAAISGADDGDVIELADGTYTGDGNRDYWVGDRMLTVRSRSGNAAACVIDPEGGPGLTHRAMNFQGAGPGFVIENVTITGGTALGAGSEGYGGAVRLYANSSPTFHGCVFVGNQAVRGGAVFTFETCSPSITDCTFVENTAINYGGAVTLSTGSSPSIVNTTFRGNSSDGSGGALTVWGATPTITSCTFEGNSAANGGVAYCRFGGAPSFVGSILAFSAGGSAVACEGGDDGDPSLSCCTVFGNAGGDWVDCIAGLDADNGNLTADPRFCDAASGDLRLQWGSPCLVANSGGCGQIGAWGAGGCPSTAVEASSWGRVKGSYR